MFDRSQGKYVGTGPYDPVSRLGNPLVNEVLIPMAYKDKWNSAKPENDSDFNKYLLKPELAGLLPVLYPGAFPNLKAYDKPRADLQAILHTGIPAGVVGRRLRDLHQHRDAGHGAAEPVHPAHPDERRKATPCSG